MQNFRQKIGVALLAIILGGGFLVLGNGGGAATSPSNLRPSTAWYVYWVPDLSEPQVQKRVLIDAGRAEDAIQKFRKEYGDEPFVTCMARNYYNRCEAQVWK